MSTTTQKECTIAGLYDLLHTIGKGHFAVVKLAKHVFTGEKVAVKVIDKTKLDHVSRDHLFQEVRCMKLVQHPHIVRLYEVIDTQTKLYLILELGDGDMYDYIMDKHNRGLDIESARIYFIQILEAISYCHALRVVHRDLKPENVIFFEKLGIVKLTDFGFSNRFEPDTKLDTSCGSLAYSAPEILLGDSYDAPAVDVWSLGVLLYMLVTGEPPFQEANDSETLTMIMDCKYRIPPHIPADCANLISSMLRREPSSRISLDNIIRHPWVEVSSNSNHCCVEALCTSLVSKEHLSQEDQEVIIQKMAEGGIATRSEIHRALEIDEYSHITATFYLLAERKLKKQHDERKIPNGSVSAKSSQFHRSNSQPGFMTTNYMDMDSERASSIPLPNPSVDTSSNVYVSRQSSVVSGREVQTDSSSASVQISIPDSNSRRFSLIEEDEECDYDDLRDSFIVVKETVSESTAYPKPSSAASMNTGQLQAQTSDFEQSLSNMSLRRQRQAPSNNQSRPLRTVTSSPQIAPLKQIHEEGEVPTQADDSLSTHSQSSMIRLRNSTLSMASPEVARKIITKKKNRKTTSCSDDTASETEDDKKKDRERISPNFFSLPHKRKDSSDYSSDTDGAGVGGSKPRNKSSDKSKVACSSSKTSQHQSPIAKKRYSESTKRSSVAPQNPQLADKQDTQRRKPSRNKSANNSGKDDNSLLTIASKLVDSSLARLSNFSLASQTSSLSSRSSKFSSSTTPRSTSKHRSKDAKLSKLRLLHNLNNRNFEFSELSDVELESDSTSHSSSIKLTTIHPVISTEEQYNHITAEPDSAKSHNKLNKACCAIM